jgi:hypothetical protein
MLIEFEGYYDSRAGWDFSAPLLMVKPVIQMHEVGSICEADRVVEDAIEAIGLGDELEPDEEINRRAIMRAFRKAKKGHKQFIYWRMDVDIPDDINWDAEDAFERVVYGDLEIQEAPADA